MLAGKRAVRVGDQILKEIAVLLLERVKDPRVRAVTVTGIRLSDDLKLARVYYSVLGDEKEIKRAQSGLDRAKGFIKREIGMRMALRYIPQITFVHDPTLESASRMDRFFKEMGKMGEDM
jgi:ribosome-binding factor A